MTDLWYEASMDHEGLAREAALDHVTAELDGIMPFLLAARSDQEFSHRLALAAGRLETIAITHGVAPEDVSNLAARRYVLMREALQEGMDPLDTMLQSVHEYGSGPQVPDGHHTDSDFSHGYSEVPQGAPGGPAPQVVTPRFPGPEPLADVEGKKKKHKKDGQEWLTANGDEERGKHKTGSLQHQAEGDANYMAETPPDLGTGKGSQDIGVKGPAGPPSVPAGGDSAPGTTPMTPPSIGQVTSSKDPVRMQVLAVAQSVRASNPWLPEHEVMRVARTAVGRYFTRTADTDWSPTIMSDAPPKQTGGSGSGGGGGGGLGSAVEHGLEWQGAKSLMGGGAAAGGELADVAAVAAL